MISRVPQPTKESVLIREFLRQCRPVRLREVGDWAEQEIRIPSGPFEGRRYRMDRLPYARHLLGQIGKWRRHVVTGPTQAGKSLNAFVLPIIYYLFEMKEDVICGVPDLTMSGEKWQKDIKPVIERSRYADMIPNRGAGSQGGNPVMITFRNGRSLRFMAGGGGDKQRAGSTGRVLVITETDGMDEVSKTSKEGQDKISQLEGRVRAYGEEARIFMECTVSTDTGRTWRELKAGTDSKLACPCPHCGHYVSPEREHLTGWEQAESKIQAGKISAWTCPECGIFLSENDRRLMNEQSVLVHRGQEVTPSGEIVGNVVETDTFSFRWNAFNNLLSTASLVSMEEWQAAQSEDVEAVQTAIKQQVHTIPAKNTNVERVPISVGVVRGSKPKYAGRCSGINQGVVPDGFDMLTAFIDISRRVLHWSVESKNK